MLGWRDGTGSSCGPALALYVLCTLKAAGTSVSIVLYVPSPMAGLGNPELSDITVLTIASLLNSGLLGGPLRFPIGGIIIPISSIGGLLER